MSVFFQRDGERGGSDSDSNGVNSGGTHGDGSNANSNGINSGGARGNDGNNAGAAPDGGKR